jgi:hypothetical protein
MMLSGFLPSSKFFNNQSFPHIFPSTKENTMITIFRFLFLGLCFFAALLPMQAQNAITPIKYGFFAQAGYGLPTVSHPNIRTTFARPLNAELAFGYAIHTKAPFGRGEIREFQMYDLYANGLINSGANDVPANIIRFGTRFRKGIGYGLGEEASLIPYAGSGLLLSVVSLGNGKLPNADEQAILADYAAALRIGQVCEGGLSLHLKSGLGIHAGFERSMAYPRYIFLEDAVSSIIQFYVAEFGAQLAAAAVQSETLSPILYFIIRNGIQFGVSELRRNAMNWPFQGQAPLTVDTYKISLSWTF